MNAYQRLVRAGIHPLRAQQLADAGYDVIDIIPIGWLQPDGEVRLAPLDREPAAS